MSDNRENKHNEEPHDSEEEKYSFLQETVKDEQRSKKGIMGNLCRLAGRGLIFGLAAGLAFYALRPWRRIPRIRKHRRKRFSIRI